MGKPTGGPTVVLYVTHAHVYLLPGRITSTMSTADPASGPGVTSRLLDSAGRPFVGVAFAVPLLAALAAAWMGDVTVLNLVHVVSGVVWAGATVFVAGVYGPTLQAVDPQVRGQVNTPMIPKTVTLFSGVAVATLVTGPVLAVEMGMWSLSNQYVLGAVVLAAGLLVGAVSLVWLQIEVFGEVTGPGPPDGERLEALGGRIGMMGAAMLVLQLAILVDMSLLATA